MSKQVFLPKNDRPAEEVPAAGRFIAFSSAEYARFSPDKSLGLILSGAVGDQKSVPITTLGFFMYSKLGDIYILLETTVPLFFVLSETSIS